MSTIKESAARGYEMRTYEFRAWDFDKKLYLEDFFISPSGRLVDDDFYGPIVFYNTEEIVLMQFTGLLDKNGVKIFEGDVVETNSIDGILKWVYKFSDSCCVIGFSPESINHQFSSIHNSVRKEGVVIGNIFQNPELIEVNNGETL
jgi:uncharacterized phage protein (TIGR01671 family)